MASEPDVPKVEASKMATNSSPDERARSLARAEGGVGDAPPSSSHSSRPPPKRGADAGGGGGGSSGGMAAPETQEGGLDSHPSPDERSRARASVERSGAGPGAIAVAGASTDDVAAKKRGQVGPRMTHAASGGAVQAGAVAVSGAAAAADSSSSSESAKAAAKALGRQHRLRHRPTGDVGGPTGKTPAATTAPAVATAPAVSRGDCVSERPGAHSVKPSHCISDGGGESDRPSIGDLDQTQSSMAMDMAGIALVSAKLVVDDGVEDNHIGAIEKGSYKNEEEKVYEVAQEVSSGYCYIGKRRVHRCAVFGLVAAVIAVAVAVPVALTRRDGSGAGSLEVNPGGTCGKGNRGNGLCRNGECCSPFGHCGDSPDHCAADRPPGAVNETNATIGPVSADKVCGGYYADWNPIPAIRNVHPNFNLVNLFAARRGDATDGSVSFTPPYDAEEFRADVAAERSSDRKRSFVLSLGGSGHGFVIPDRAFAKTLLDSIVDIYDQVGGLDGLDWDIFKDNEPSTDEMIWIGNELKVMYPGFLLTASVVPHRKRDKEFCRTAIDASALDFCTPVFYGGPGLSAQSDIVDYVKDWVDEIGEEHLVIGLGVHPEELYFQRSEEAKATYREIKSLFPDIRGVLNWNIQNDFAHETGFAGEICTV